MSVPPPPDLHPVPDGGRRVKRRSNVEIGELVRLGVDAAAVIVINDVADVAAASVDDPVVAVKWVLVSETDNARL